MRDTPLRALRRAPLLAAVATAVVVLAALTASRLASDPSPAATKARPRATVLAHAAAAPPQSLAFTAEFFATMGLDARDEPVTPAPEPVAAPEATVPAPCSVRADKALAERRAPHADSARARVAADAVQDSAILTAATVPSAPRHGIAVSRSE